MIISITQFPSSCMKLHNNNFFELAKFFYYFILQDIAIQFNKNILLFPYVSKFRYPSHISSSRRLVPLLFLLAAAVYVTHEQRLQAVVNLISGIILIILVTMKGLKRQNAWEQPQSTTADMYQVDANRERTNLPRSLSLFVCSYNNGSVISFLDLVKCNYLISQAVSPVYSS